MKRLKEHGARKTNTGTNEADQRSHLARFNCEEELRRTVAALLTRLPNHKNVQLAHGPLEKGKDVIFSITGGFGNTEHCACVVKNGPITADHTKRRRISDVLGQVKQALNSPFLDAGAREAFVTKCFIICPYEISQVTLAIIKEELHQLGERVSVIDGPKLFQLLQEYYPEYKAEEFGALRKAREHVRHDVALGKLAFATLRAEASRDTHLIYVKPHFEIILREWSVRRSTLLSEIVPPLPDPVRARDKDRKKIEPSATNFYSTPSNYTLSLEQARSKFAKRTEIFTRTKLLTKARVDAVISAYDELITCARLATNPVESSKLLRSLEVDYENRLIIPPRDFIVISPANAGPLMASIRHLREAVSQVITSIDKTLAESIPSGPLVATTDLARAMHVSDVFHFEASPYVTEKRIIRIPLQEDSFYRSGPAVLIVGPAGYGKTSFCQWHTLEDDKLFSKGSHDWVSVYVPLHKLTDEEISSMSVAIEKHAAHVSKLYGRQVIKRSIGYRVYLDGLDEVDDENARSKIITFVKANRQLGAPTEYVLTSRDYVVGAETEGIPRFYICPLSDSQIADLAKLWLTDPDRSRDFLRQLDENPALKELARIPLLCTLTVLVYRKTPTLPASRLRLYETFVELLCSGWDLAKGLQRGSKVKSDFKALLLRKLALLAHAERKKAFKERDLNLVVSRLNLRFSKADIAAVLEELLADGLIQRSADSFEFRHLSLQEFLAASDLFCDPSKEAANTCLALYLDGDLWWRDVMAFYALQIQDPVSTERWIEQQMKIQKLTNSAAVTRSTYLRNLVRAGFSGP